MSEEIQGVMAVIAALALFSAPVLIVYFVLRHRRQVTAMKLKAATDFTERGATVPFDLLLAKPRWRSDDGDLRIGLVLTCIGIGTVLFAFTLKEHELWGLGLLPLFAGIGFLITWKLSRRAGTADQDG